MKALEYKGYYTHIEYDSISNVYHGKVEGIGDLVTFENEDVSLIEEEFHKAVDDYLAFSKEIALINEYLSYPYPMTVIPDAEEGGYTLCFPDLPGCATCVESLDNLEKIAEDTKREWFKAAIEDGIEIKLPNNMKQEGIT